MNLKVVPSQVVNAVYVEKIASIFAEGGLPESQKDLKRALKDKKEYKLLKKYVKGLEKKAYAEFEKEVRLRLRIKDMKITI